MRVVRRSQRPVPVIRSACLPRRVGDDESIRIVRLHYGPRRRPRRSCDVVRAVVRDFQFGTCMRLQYGNRLNDCTMKRRDEAPPADTADARRERR